MGQKDLSAKEFLGCPDVFADIGNALLYEGGLRMRQENLRHAPTESFYEGEKGELHDQLQDVSMYEMLCGTVRLQYIFENQTHRDRKMVLRKAGYCGGVYRRQMSVSKNTSSVFPCICIVLYWGKGNWNQPRSLEELFGDEQTDERDRPYIDDIQLHVFEMRNLSRKVRKRFRSDMRFVVDYLAEDEENIPKHRKVHHAKEMLRLLRAVTGDARYTEITDSLSLREKEKGEIEMCEILDKYINRGIEQGIEQGEN